MFELKIIESGFFLADGGAMFGAIPKRAWMRKYPQIEDNLCPMAMRCLLARSVDGERIILVDLGMGDKYLDKVDYYQPSGLVNIADQLAEEGLATDDVTDVVLTHLHFDHCGYATRYNEDGKAIPSFGKARYWLSKEQWETYLEPSRLEADSIFGEDIQALVDADLLHIIDSETSLGGGWQIKIYGGHSAGQLVPIFLTNDGFVACPSDLIPTSAHVPLEWISAYDISAITALKEKERFLREAIEYDYRLIYYHDAYTTSSKVKRLNDNYIACQKQKV